MKLNLERRIKMKNFKAMILTFICIGIFLSRFTLSANAYGTIMTIDNDVDNSLYYTYADYGNWQYITDSGCMNGNARIASTGPYATNSYAWYLKNSYGTSRGQVTVKLSVYLNYSLFCDSAASYWIDCDLGNMYDGWGCGSVDQNLAPSGWNTLSTVNCGNGSSQCYIRGFTVTNSEVANKYVGADAIKVEMSC